MNELDVRHRGAGAGAEGRPGMWRRRPAGWAIPLLAVFVAVVVWAVGRTSGIELEVRVGSGTRVVGVADVTVAALVAGLAGWGVRALIRRITGGGDKIWLTLCAVVLLVSLLGPLGAAPLASAGLLVAEHVAVGAVVALGLSDRRRGLRGTPAAPGA